MRYLTVTEEEKLELLRAEDVGGVGWECLDQKAWCLFCNRQFQGKNVRIFLQGEDVMLGCGTTGCGGGPFEWSSAPWWRPQAARQRA